MKPDELAVGIVALSGGELVGRTRLQKTAYLLDHSGMKSKLTYDYHYYGPFSFDLAEGWALAAKKNLLQLETKPGRHEVPFTIFRTTAEAPAKLGALSSDKARDIIGKLQKRSDIVLELAATIRFFSERRDVEDPIAEVKRRKPLKATAERIQEAKALLRDLGFSVDVKGRSMARA